MESDIHSPETDPTGPEVTKLFKEELKKYSLEAERAERLDLLEEFIRECLYEKLISETTPVGEALQIIKKHKLELIDDGGEGELPEDAMP